MTDAFDDRGGGEVVVAHLAKALRARWDVRVLTTTRGTDEVVKVHGLTVYRIHSDYPPRLRPLLSLANPLVTRKVAMLVRRHRPQVVHAWNVHAHLSYEALRLVHRAGVPVVLTYQDAQPFCYSKFKCWIDPRAPCPKRPNYRANPRTCSSCRQHYWLFPPRNRLVRMYVRRFVSRGVSVSEALAAALHANAIPHVTVVHNGLPLEDSALAHSSGERARQRHGWAQDQLVVTGGRLHFFKGQRLAVEAFASIAAERPNTRLVILGGAGWFRDSLAEQAAGLCLSDRVSFPGFLDRADYYDCLAAADLFLNLSMYLDPFPTVNLEAMALAVPVLGTCYGGTPEAIEDGVTGYLANPYDVDGVAARAVGVLDDGPLRAQLGKAGRQRVERKFTIQRMVERYESIYAEVSAADA